MVTSPVAATFAPAQTSSLPSAEHLDLAHQHVTFYSSLRHTVLVLVMIVFALPLANKLLTSSSFNKALCRSGPRRSIVHSNSKSQIWETSYAERNDADASEKIVSSSEGLLTTEHRAAKPPAVPRKTRPAILSKL
jgi:ABC-type glycerol-3-phosphate transport system permease component